MIIFSKGGTSWTYLGHILHSARKPAADHTQVVAHMVAFQDTLRNREDLVPPQAVHIHSPRLWNMLTV